MKKKTVRIQEDASTEKSSSKILLSDRNHVAQRTTNDIVIGELPQSMQEDLFDHRVSLPELFSKSQYSPDNLMKLWNPKKKRSSRRDAPKIASRSRGSSQGPSANNTISVSDLTTQEISKLPSFKHSEKHTKKSTRLHTGTTTPGQNALDNQSKSSQDSKRSQRT